MIPSHVQNYLEKGKGIIFRKNKDSAVKVLQSLGIDIADEFSEFYLKYQGGFISPNPLPELLDIEGPAIPAIPDQTEYVQDRYDLPDKYLALTTDESEGMYLYDKENKAVYDFDLTTYDQFMQGNILPRWNSFNTFLSWYFCIT